MSVADKTLPCEHLYFGICCSHRRFRAKQLLATGSELFALANKMVVDEAKGAIGHYTGADVKVAGISGANAERFL